MNEDAMNGIAQGDSEASRWAAEGIDYDLLRANRIASRIIEGYLACPTLAVAATKTSGGLLADDIIRQSFEAAVWSAVGRDTCEVLYSTVLELVVSVSNNRLMPGAVQNDACAEISQSVAESAVKAERSRLNRCTFDFAGKAFRARVQGSIWNAVFDCHFGVKRALSPADYADAWDATEVATVNTWEADICDLP